MQSSKSQFFQGFAAGIPVLLGYFPIAVTFGLLSKSAGLALAETVFFSAAVFAGASQFIALNMINLGAAAGEIIVTVFLINLRHILMSASLALKIPKPGRIIPLTAFGVTDETFALNSLRPGSLKAAFVTGVNTAAYSGWVSGTASGFLAGKFIPEKMQASLGILLYVMFISILVPEIKKNRKSLSAAGFSAVINFILLKTTPFNSGWCIVISIVSASILSMYVYRKEQS